ncbi:MAG: YbjN domain-containing protein [Ruminiclostridium sp.]
MSDEELLELGKNVYETICAMFDENGYRYSGHEDNLTITCSFRGDDLPMDMCFAVYEDRQLVRLTSPMPFNIPEEQRAYAALAVNAANCSILNGHFVFDMSDGSIVYCVNQSYIDSILGKEVFNYMLAIANSTIDKFNDLFFMLGKGMITLDDFLDKMHS